MPKRILNQPTSDWLYREVPGDLAAFLGQFTWDQTILYDDFHGDQIPFDATAPGKYTVATGVDGAFAIESANQGQNGIATLSASDGVGADTEYCGLSLVGPTAAFAPTFSGDRHAFMAARVTLDDVTTVKVEIGFTDVYNDAGAVDSLAGNTFTAANAAVWCFDTADNTLWQGCGVMAGTAITKVEPTASELPGPVAATYQTMGVQIETNAVRFLSWNANGHLVYASPFQASGIEGGTAITPWVFVQIR